MYTLANIFNENSTVILKVFSKNIVTANEFPEFDDAVHHLVQGGFTIKTETTNSIGEYSLWFERKEQDKNLGKRPEMPNVKANLQEFAPPKFHDNNSIPTEWDSQKASDVDSAYTKMIANQIARQSAEDLNEQFKPRKND